MNNKIIPTIETERLRLRPFSLDDASELQRLASDIDIASTLLTLPHPYEDGVAEQFIKARQEKFERRESIDFAVTHRKEMFIIGDVGLIFREYESAEIAYWIGKPFWNKGYCAEAGEALVRFGFDVLGMNRIYGRHMTRNPSSGRVMQKIGMKYEGRLRQNVKKWDKFEENVIESDKGFCVEILGKTSLKYIQNNKFTLIRFEITPTTNTLNIIENSVTQWSSGEPVDDETRRKVVFNVAKALTWDGKKVQSTYRKRQ
jgi:[ribosomal protein S5]-alanine N-acetyltransferase